MAGGKGVRLNSGEKPLAELRGKALVAYVIEALLKSPGIGHIYVAVSPWTPGTGTLVQKLFRGEKRVSVLMTPGAGYIDDTAFAVKSLELFRPFMIISSDIPLIKPETIDAVVREYEKTETEALSVRVRLSSVPPGVSTDMILTDNGIENVPAAINILDGRYMDRYQQEALLILEDPLLAANVNYMPDLSVCEKLMSESSINRQVH